MKEESFVLNIHSKDLALFKPFESLCLSYCDEHCINQDRWVIISDLKELIGICGVSKLTHPYLLKKYRLLFFFSFVHYHQDCREESYRAIICIKTRGQEGTWWNRHWVGSQDIQYEENPQSVDDLSVTNCQLFPWWTVAFYPIMHII